MRFFYFIFFSGSRLLHVRESICSHHHHHHRVREVRSGAHGALYLGGNGERSDRDSALVLLRALCVHGVELLKLYHRGNEGNGNLQKL